MTDYAILPARASAASEPTGADLLRHARPSGAHGLSERERDVLRLLGQGLTNKEAAQRLGVAPETIKSHIKHIFRKLAVERRAHAVARGLSLGLIAEGSDDFAQA